MQTLPSEFKSGGFDYKLLKRECDVALFEKTQPNHTVMHYEVVVVQSLPAATMYGKDYPEREKMPTPEQWGEFGWTPFDFAAAQSRFFEHLRLCRSGKILPSTFTETHFDSASDTKWRNGEKP